MGAAVILYAIGAIRAVRVLRPHDYGGARVDHLRDIADNYWDGGPSEALRAIYDTVLEMLAQAKSSNEQKAGELEHAIWAEVIATGVLAFGALLTLLGG